ncbi:MAG: hypothetical protein H0T84_08890 [Tatlockia sp.]|nr:hypothetical protein [Tatlockia sp.]
MKAKLEANFDEQRSRLNLSNQGIADEDIPAILDFVNKHKVKQLILHKNWITGKGAAQISSNEYINILNLALNKVDSAGFAFLIKNPFIEELDLFGNCLTNEVAESLRTNKTLLKIDLENNDIDVELMHSIMNRIKLNSTPNFEDIQGFSAPLKSPFPSTVDTLFNHNTKQTLLPIDKESACCCIF